MMEPSVNQNRNIAQQNLDSDDPDIGPSAESYRLRDSIGTILRIANQNAVDVFNRKITAEFGEPIVTTTQFAVLSTLWRNGDLSHSETAERTCMDMPTLHSVLKRLERKGLLITIADAKDRRRRIVRLSESGRALAFRLRNMGADISDQILAPLDAEQRKLFLGLLKKFNTSRRDIPKD